MARKLRLFLILAGAIALVIANTGIVTGDGDSENAGVTLPGEFLMEISGATLFERGHHLFNRGIKVGFERERWQVAPFKGDTAYLFRRETVLRGKFDGKAIETTLKKRILLDPDFNMLGFHMVTSAAGGLQTISGAFAGYRGSYIVRGTDAEKEFEVKHELPLYTAETIAFLADNGKAPLNESVSLMLFEPVACAFREVEITVNEEAGILRWAADGAVYLIEKGGFIAEWPGLTALNREDLVIEEGKGKELADFSVTSDDRLYIRGLRDNLYSRPDIGIAVTLPGNEWGVSAVRREDIHALVTHHASSVRLKIQLCDAPGQVVGIDERLAGARTILNAEYPVFRVLKDGTFEAAGHSGAYFDARYLGRSEGISRRVTAAAIKVGDAYYEFRLYGPEVFLKEHPDFLAAFIGANIKFGAIDMNKTVATYRSGDLGVRFSYSKFQRLVEKKTGDGLLSVTVSGSESYFELTVVPLPSDSELDIWADAEAGNYSRERKLKLKKTDLRLGGGLARRYYKVSSEGEKKTEFGLICAVNAGFGYKIAYSYPLEKRKSIEDAFLPIATFDFMEFGESPAAAELKDVCLAYGFELDCPSLEYEGGEIVIEPDIRDDGNRISIVIESIAPRLYFDVAVRPRNPSVDDLPANVLAAESAKLMKKGGKDLRIIEAEFSGVDSAQLTGSVEIKGNSFSVLAIAAIRGDRVYVFTGRNLAGDRETRGYIEKLFGSVEFID